VLAVRCRLPADLFAGAAAFGSAVAAASGRAGGAAWVDGALFAEAASAFAKTGFGDAGGDCAGCGVAAGACAGSPLLAGAAAIGAEARVAKAGLGATGGTAVTTGAPVTSACAAIEFSASAPGRSSRESTTAAPAVAPTAVATSTIRAPRRKLGAGAR
jgi:hypothetical protein